MLIEEKLVKESLDSSIGNFLVPEEYVLGFSGRESIKALKKFIEFVENN